MIFWPQSAANRVQAFSAPWPLPVQASDVDRTRPLVIPCSLWDPIAEYEAVRNHVGILDLCQRNLLRFTGRDRTSFLNRLISNDLTALTSGQGLHIHGP